MSTLLTMDLSEISIVERKERSLVTVDIHRETSFEEKVELITAETEKYQLGRLHDVQNGALIIVIAAVSVFGIDGGGLKQSDFIIPHQCFFIDSMHGSKLADCEKFVFFIHNIFSFSIYGLDRTVTVWFIIPRKYRIS